MTAVFSKPWWVVFNTIVCLLHQQITEIETAEVVQVWSANLIMCSWFHILECGARAASCTPGGKWDLENTYQTQHAVAIGSLCTQAWERPCPSKEFWIVAIFVSPQLVSSIPNWLHRNHWVLSISQMITEIA
jgi:hypothetical protein